MNSVQRHAPALVANRLTELAQQEASGALQVGGDPGGTIYLSDGRLAFAESAVVPDLGSRLVNSRRLRVDQWRLAQRDSQPGGSAGDLLLRRGLLDEAVRLAGYDIAPDARLRLRGRTRLMFGCEAAVVLGQMDGRATIRELASRNGLALFAMMDWAARLIQDGVCAITSPEHTARRPPMPVRRDNPAVRRESAAVRGDSTGVQWTSPDLSLLGRVLTKLRQLD